MSRDYQEPLPDSMACISSDCQALWERKRNIKKHTYIPRKPGGHFFKVPETFQDSSVTITFEILLRLSRCENVSGPSWNRPQNWHNLYLYNTDVYLLGKSTKSSCPLVLVLKRFDYTQFMSADWRLSYRRCMAFMVHEKHLGLTGIQSKTSAILVQNCSNCNWVMKPTGSWSWYSVPKDGLIAQSLDHWTQL